MSQSFSRSYGSILPTSLTYIVLWTRGCSPWRPAAVMGTAKQQCTSCQSPPSFMERLAAHRTAHKRRCSAALTATSPDDPIRWPATLLTRDDISCRSCSRCVGARLRCRTLSPPRTACAAHREATRCFGSGMLTRCPFDTRAGDCRVAEAIHPGATTRQLGKAFADVLGPTHPWPIDVRMEPCSTSVFKQVHLR